MYANGFDINVGNSERGNEPYGFSFFLAYMGVGSDLYARYGDTGDPDVGGEQLVFSGTVSLVNICNVSATKAIIVFRDLTVLTAIAIEWNGSSIDVGTGVTFGTGSDLSAIGMNTGEVLVCFRDGTDTFGKTVVIAVSGLTLTPSAEVTFSGVIAVSSTGVARLTSTRAICSCVATTVRGVVIDIVAGVPVPSTFVDIGETAIYSAICQLDNNEAIVVFVEVTTQDLRAMALTSIDTIFTLHTVIDIDTGGAYDNAPSRPWLGRIDNDRIIVVYQTQLTPRIIRGVILSEFDGTLTPGTIVNLTEITYDEFPTIAVVDPTRAIVAYDDVNNGIIFSVAIAGTTVIYNSDENIYTTDNILYSSLTPLSTIT